MILSYGLTLIASLSKGLCALENFWGSLESWNDFDEFHDWYRVEKVDTDYAGCAGAIITDLCGLTGQTRE